MSRDYKEYVYWTIPIKRGGKTYQAIMQDAKNHGDTKQIPTLLSVRIEQFYELREAGLLYTVQGGEPPSPMGEQEKPLEDESIEVLTVDPSREDANFEEASNYWE